ncbi:hypothetical protein CEUSTIGMA_g3386.t1 [Chlamydomonas eustigma]|uniref:Sulfotransferase n=1 Tax=Chlamydomonas eustigma TaxID=1157962 RepID=A0A250WYM2_9CHLO|nr:hypothetical protein CEUSTIGMA_g3386.t1 [Chlamydomonas eustigma]|eukprot:GAX75943.1 hypothetical protein CEUSTIGMA_g3386.t1 [Chlamydomonas eustigma]
MSSDDTPVYQFHKKHRWEVKLHMMSGITLMPWARFLWHYWRCVDWLVYPHRVFFLTFMSILNTVLAIPDWFLYSQQIAAQPLHPEPVIILGHPRTGTTHLHNLLSLDPEFAFCNTFHAGFPSSFITLEPLQGLLSPLMEERRPMDNMALSWGLPAEDEIAINVLSGGVSPYASLVLPREEERSLRGFFSFMNTTSSDDDVSGGICTLSDATSKEIKTGEVGQIGGIASTNHADGETNSYSSHQSRTHAITADGISQGTRSNFREGVRASAGTASRSASLHLERSFKVWQSCFLHFLKKVTFWHILKSRLNEGNTALRSLFHSGSTKRMATDPTTTPVSSSCTRDSAAAAAAASSPPPSSGSKPLLIKSPVHTARIRLLLDMFPKARFIYIHRHPIDVFRSAAHMADTYYWYTYLQLPSNQQVTEFILNQYEVLYKRYIEDRRLVHSDQLHELSFRDLEADPITSLKEIYCKFGWLERFERLRPDFERYCFSLSDFKRNHFAQPLDPRLVSTIETRWSDSYSEFGYKKSNNDTPL